MVSPTPSEDRATTTGPGRPTGRDDGRVARRSAAVEQNAAAGERREPDGGASDRRLPEPDSPTRPTTSPCGTMRLTSSTAGSATGPSRSGRSRPRCAARSCGGPSSQDGLGHVTASDFPACQQATRDQVRPMDWRSTSRQCARRTGTAPRTRSRPGRPPDRRDGRRPSRVAGAGRSACRAPPRRARGCRDAEPRAAGRPRAPRRYGRRTSRAPGRTPPNHHTSWLISRMATSSPRIA